MECDFQDMPLDELQNLRLKSIYGWAEKDEEWVIQGFTTTLSNGMSEPGDFYDG